MTQVVLFTGGAATYTLPSDWNTSNNKIEGLGSGGNGGVVGGNGGGAYASISNLSDAAGTVENVQVGAGAGTTTTQFKNSSTLVADYGRSATTGTGASGGLAANCVGTVKNSGGNGGTSGSAGCGGGGGAAGPNGAGQNGGNGSTGGGGGGGGSNGGSSSVGSPGSATQGGNGGNGTGGTGGGVGGLGAGGAGTTNSGGGGAGGAPSFAGGNCSADTQWTSVGCGGGGGGGGHLATGGGDTGIDYGGAAGGKAGGTSPGAGDGLLIITYTPLSNVTWYPVVQDQKREIFVSRAAATVSPITAPLLSQTNYFLPQYIDQQRLNLNLKTDYNFAPIFIPKLYIPWLPQFLDQSRPNYPVQQNFFFEGSLPAPSITVLPWFPSYADQMRPNLRMQADFSFEPILHINLPPLSWLPDYNDQSRPNYAVQNNFIFQGAITIITPPTNISWFPSFSDQSRPNYPVQQNFFFEPVFVTQSLLPWFPQYIDQSRSNLRGQADFTIETIEGGPLKIPSANLYALYSIAQYSIWTGNCLRIQRGSDNAQQDVGFLNGFLDINSAISFAGGSSISVVKVYDQSGNSRDIVNSANYPTLSTANTINGIPGITFWNGTLLKLPASISLSSQSVTALIATAMNSSNYEAFLLELNTAWTSGLTLLPWAADDQVLDNSAFRNTGIYSYSQPGFFALTSSATSKTYQFDNKLVTGIGASSATTMTGGQLYVSPDLGGYTGYGEFYMLALYNTVLSQPTITAAQPNIYNVFNINTTSNYRVLWDGDSITMGTGSTLGINNPRQAQPLLNYPVYFRNIGAFGQTFATMRSNETNNVINSYDSSLAKNVLVVAGGINDITANTTGANLWANTAFPYIQAAQAAGYAVIVGTLIYDANATAGQDTQRQAYNTLVRNNTVTYGYTLLDYDTITQLKNPQQGGYSSDGTHPTTAGYLLMAQLAASTINSLLFFSIINWFPSYIDQVRPNLRMQADYNFEPIFPLNLPPLSWQPDYSDQSRQNLKVQRDFFFEPVLQINIPNYWLPSYADQYREPARVRGSAVFTPPWIVNLPLPWLPGYSNNIPPFIQQAPGGEVLEPPIAPFFFLQWLPTLIDRSGELIKREEYYFNRPSAFGIKWLPIYDTRRLPEYRQQNFLTTEPILPLNLQLPWLPIYPDQYRESARAKPRNEFLVAVTPFVLSTITWFPDYPNNALPILRQRYESFLNVAILHPATPSGRVILSKQHDRSINAHNYSYRHPGKEP